MTFQTTIETTVTATAQKATMLGSAGTLVGWATSSDIAVWAGILIGVLGLLINWWFKRRHDKRAEAAHTAFMKRMKNSDGLPYSFKYEQTGEDD